MIDRERQIASLFAIAVGFMLLVLVPHLMPEVEADLPEPELTMPEQFCDNVRLRDPGGMGMTLAMVCVNGEFEIVTNAGHLKPDKWNTLIQPVLDSLRTEAKSAGINTQGINGYVR